VWNGDSQDLAAMLGEVDRIGNGIGVTSSIDDERPTATVGVYVGAATLCEFASGLIRLSNRDGTIRSEATQF
jgi:hypothetical protein